METIQYKETTNPVATYGEKSPSTLAFQQSLNQKYAGKTGYTPLKEDSLYGPKTLAASKFSGPGVVSTVDIHNQGKKDGKSLTDALRLFNVNYTDPNAPVDPNAKPKENKTPGMDDTTDPYMKSLTDLSARSNDSTKMLITNIMAAKQRQRNSVNTEYDKYKGGLQLLGIQHNEAQATPELLQGRVQEAENQHQAKISEIDAEEAKALIDAEDARANNDFKVLKEKMDYVKTLKKEKADELKALHDTLTNTQKTAQIEAHDIFDTLYELEAEDQEAFLVAVAQKFNLPMGTLVQALADEKAKRGAADLKTKNTESIITKREAPPKAGTGTTGGKPIVSGGVTITQSQIKAGEDKLVASKGTDGYVDPDVYKKSYDEWPGTKKDFLAKFPPNNWVNPENKNAPQPLPQYLQSTKKGGAKTTAPAGVNNPFD